LEKPFHPILGEKTWGMSVTVDWDSKRRAADSEMGATLRTCLNALGFQMKIGRVFVIFFFFFNRKNTGNERM
jgi:hypothetical protein